MVLRHVAAALALLTGMVLCGCSGQPEGPRSSGPAPSSAEVQSLLGASVTRGTEVVGDRGFVLIDITSPVSGSPAPAGPAESNSMTIVAACVLSKRSGGPYGFAVGVVPTQLVTPEIRARAQADEYRSLIKENCAPD